MCIFLSLTIIYYYKVAISTAKTDYYASLIRFGEGNTRTSNFYSFHFQAYKHRWNSLYIQKSKSANCQLDPIPLTFSLSSLITDIIHNSLVSGTVSSSLKTAVIIQVTDHFRPILNLLFLSNIQERIVAAQVQDHLSDNSLHEQFQSGFHS